MKKIYIALAGLLFLLFATRTDAQVKNYRFSQSTGTFTSVSIPATVHASGWDDAIATTAIPFTFTFNGIGYTSCSVNTNGYLTFGATTSSSNNYNPISAGTGFAGSVSAFGRDLISNASAIVSGTEGIAPNRSFVIQWNNAQRYSLGAIAGDVMNFQIRLNETANSIDIVYGTCTATSTSSYTLQAGLRGASNADFSNRTSAASWAASNLGTANSSTVTTLNTILPSSGLTFTWTPASCSIPGAILVPAGTITATTATINWTAATPAPASGYEWKVTAQGAGSEGAAAASGSVAAGVVTASSTGLTAGSSYAAYVRSNCGGTFGSWTGPTNFTTSVLCAVPTAVTTNTITSTSANVTWTGTGAFIIEYGLTGFTPGTGSAAGIGGTIINPAITPQAITGLAPATGYDVYVRKDCTGAGNGYSTNVKLSFTTAIPAPVNDNCLSASVINTYPYNFNQTDGAGATQTGFVAACSLGMNDGLWYKLTGTGCQQTITVTPTTSWDLEIGVYTGTCGTFTCVTSADANNAGSAETVTFTGVAGTDYYINIGHYSGTTDSPEGPFTINATQICCVAPTSVATNTITSASANVTWTGTGSFILEYGLAGFTPGTGAAAGTGGTVIDPAIPPQAITGLTSNTAYDVYIRQNCTGAGNGYSSNSSKTTFTTLALPPANDDCANAVTLTPSVSCVTTPGTVLGATNSADYTGQCTAGTADDDVWYKFVATATSTTISTSGFDGVIDLSSSADGTCGTLTNVSCVDNTGSTDVLTAATVIGTTYYVRFYSYSSTALTGTGAAFTICVTVPPPPPACTTNISPADMAANVATIPSVTFTWNAAATATSYDLYVGTTAASATLVGNYTTTTINIIGFSASTVYFWYVIPKNSGGSATGCVSNATSFTTAIQCNPSTANGGTSGDRLRDFVLNGEASTAISVTNASAMASPGYVDLSATTTVNLAIGKAYAGNFRVQNPEDYVSIWIDFNNNGGFESNERVLNNLRPIGGNTTSPFSIYIPASVTAGVYKMRVRDVYYASAPTVATDPCSYYGYGEGKDFTVNIVSTGTAYSVSSVGNATCTQIAKTTIDAPSNNTSFDVPVLDATGAIVASLNANGNDLGTITASVYRNTSGAVRQNGAGVYYLDRNYTITPAKQPAAGNVTVRLYYTAAELAALQAVEPTANSGNLSCTKTQATCASSWVTNSDVSLGQAGNGTLGADYYATVSVPSFSSFFLDKEGVPLTLKVFLEGDMASSGATMRNDLQTYSPLLLPTTDPYGNSTTYAGIGNPAGAAGAVADWVKVEVRSAASGYATVLQSMSLLLKTDGTIVTASGAVPVFNTQTGTVRVDIIHRNHLSIQSQNITSFSGAVSYDFSTGIAKAFNAGDPAQMKLRNGVYCMIAGDVNKDFAIDGTDGAVYNNDFNAGKFDVYNASDINMDGVVDGSDGAYFNTNFNAGYFSTMINY